MKKGAEGDCEPGIRWKREKQQERGDGTLIKYNEKCEHLKNTPPKVKKKQIMVPKCRNPRIHLK